MLGWIAAILQPAPGAQQKLQEHGPLTMKILLTGHISALTIERQIETKSDLC